MISIKIPSMEVCTFHLICHTLGCTWSLKVAYIVRSHSVLNFNKMHSYYFAAIFTIWASFRETTTYFPWSFHAPCWVVTYKWWSRQTRYHNRSQLWRLWEDATFSGRSENNLQNLLVKTYCRGIVYITCAWIIIINIQSFYWLHS